MSCIALVDGVARRLHDIIQQQPNITLLETEDFGWENYRYTSPTFRLAHIEIFNQANFLVVHCCVFPHVENTAPIFGLDVVAGKNKITGLVKIVMHVVSWLQHGRQNSSLRQSYQCHATAPLCILPV